MSRKARTVVHREDRREQLPSEPHPLDFLLGNSAEWGLLIQPAVIHEDFALSLQPPGSGAGKQKEGESQDSLPKQDCVPDV